MNHSSPLMIRCAHTARARIGLPLAVLLVCLSACAAPSERPSDGTMPDSAEITAPADLRAQYELELAALRAELSALRADATLSHEALAARIDALTARMHALATALESLGAAIPEIPDTPADTASTAPPGEIPDQPPIETDASSPPTGTETIPTIMPPTETDRGTLPASPFTYTVEADHAILTAYRPAAHDPSALQVLLPATLGGSPVTHIGDNAFAETSVRSVTLPSTVTHIGWFAFSGCGDLQTLILPASVIHIDYGAFDGCPNLTIRAPADSYAARYAAAFGLRFVPT